MIQEIRNYFKTDRSYQAGAQLVMKFSQRLALKKQINIHPESKYMMGVIHEELRDIAGINLQEFTLMMAQPIEKPAKQEKKEEAASAAPAVAATAVPPADPPAIPPADPSAVPPAGKKNGSKSVGSKKASRKR